MTKLKALLLALTVTLSATAMSQTIYKTRYGELTGNSDGLFVDGQPMDSDAILLPNNVLHQKIELKNADVLVFKTDSGQACQNQFFAVYLSKKMQTATDNIGECAGQPRITIKGQSIVFTADNLAGKVVVQTLRNGQLN